jgi:GNAT superfamily N-acetyltransferase
MFGPPGLTLEIVDFEDPRAARLRGLLTDELLARYATEEEPHLFEAARKALSVPSQDFIANVLALNAVGEPIGHGALRRLNGEWEVKRVITDPAARGQGAATVLMAELERIAASAGARRVILQTGGKQPEAEAFYRKLGYRQISTYAPYEHAIPTSICFAKELQPMEDRLRSNLGQE